MLDRGEVGWSRIPVPMSDAACEFIPKLGEQRIKLGGALTADGQEVRGGHWTEDKSQDLRMVHIGGCCTGKVLNLCFMNVEGGEENTWWWFRARITRDTLLVVNSSETC